MMWWYILVIVGLFFMDIWVKVARLHEQRFGYTSEGLYIDIMCNLLMLMIGLYILVRNV